MSLPHFPLKEGPRTFCLHLSHSLTLKLALSKESFVFSLLVWALPIILDSLRQRHWLIRQRPRPLTCKYITLSQHRKEKKAKGWGFFSMPSIEKKEITPNYLSSIVIRLACSCLFSYLSFLLDCEQLKGMGPTSAYFCILSTQHRESLKHLLN